MHTPKAQKAKEQLANFAPIIENELKKYFDNELKTVFGVSTKEKKLSTHIWKHIKEHNLRPAKRLRGSFVYYGYQLLHGKKQAEILKAATSIELIHTALLMHDDFMDQDSTRRGKPTTHEYYKTLHNRSYSYGDALHYGESMAVNVGDIALLAGHQILSDASFPDKLKVQALSRLLRGIINTGFGQAYDVTIEVSHDAQEQDIIDLHLAKTAIYTYENPLHIGAILAGANTHDLKVLSNYAIPGGVAFQLQDDILGLFGDPEKTGKPAHSDLREGKVTLLIIKALEMASPLDQKKIQAIWGKKDLAQKEAEIVRKIVIESGSLDYSKALAIKYAKKAQKAIPLMHANKWDKEAINYLDGIAQYMIEREL
jgi:geranylgeranyl diphosphate synthase, type I